MKRQGELFSFGEKLYKCNVCYDMLEADDFDKHAGLPQRDGLQRTCKDCRSRSRQQLNKESYCDLCNEFTEIKYQLNEGELVFYFCSPLCFQKWVRPDDFYE